MTGDTSGLGPFELEALQDCEYNFMSKYVKVGSIKKEEVPVADSESETEENEGKCSYSVWGNPIWGSGYNLQSQTIKYSVWLHVICKVLLKFYIVSLGNSCCRVASMLISSRKIKLGSYIYFMGTHVFVVGYLARFYCNVIKLLMRLIYCYSFQLDHMLLSIIPCDLWFVKRSYFMLNFDL